MSISNNWKQFIISVLGTAIGVGLTFFVNGIQENHKKEQAQRLTAIMVIHDIDKTIERLKDLKVGEEDRNKFLQDVLKRQDHLETFSADTLARAVNLLMNGYSSFRFDISKETIFNSSLDSWHNLGSMKFMDNVQSFYYSRQDLQELLNQPDIFREPISRESYMQIIRNAVFVTEESYARKVRPFLQEQLADNHVFYFINLSAERIRILNWYINSWTELNEENKFLMGITDKDLEDYISGMVNNGQALSAARLIGRWERTQEDGNVLGYVFNRDNTYDYETHYSTLMHTKNVSGHLNFTVTYGGRWALEADSLVLHADFSHPDVQLDISDLDVKPAFQDSLDNWVKRNEEEIWKAYTEEIAKSPRISFKARLDPSNDKMQWTNEENVRYLKRKNL